MPPKSYVNTKILDKSRIFKQFVPDESQYWEIENYEKFLKKREENIIDKINTNISKLELSL